MLSDWQAKPSVKCAQVSFASTHRASQKVHKPYFPAAQVLHLTNIWRMSARITDTLLIAFNATVPLILTDTHVRQVFGHFSSLYVSYKATKKIIQGRKKIIQGHQKNNTSK